MNLPQSGSPVRVTERGGGGDGDWWEHLCLVDGLWLTHELT